MTSKSTKMKIFKTKSLTNEQKSEIKVKFNGKYSIDEISEEIDIPQKLVREYVDENLLTFSGKEGKECLEIIKNKCGSSPISELRDKVVKKNVELQEKIGQLPESNIECLKKYFLKFEESEDFFEIEESLSMEAKKCIRASSIDDVKNLSIRLVRRERVIEGYLLQYFPDEELMRIFTEEQVRQIQNLAQTFRMEELISHATYRMVISESPTELIDNLGQHEEPNMILTKLLPLTFYYFKCSLPLEEISKIITKKTNISLNTLDIFHLILQISDPIVRGLCIEHYSFSNPIPFYYPRIGPYNENQTCCSSEINKELWYSVQQFNGLVSFGLGWASWNPVGKSHLLDLTFETDFMETSPRNSAFHLGSIDIQMTKNLYGDKKDNTSEATNWAYIDCHGYSDMKIITEICQNLDIALVHVTHTDFTNQDNYARINQDLHKITNNTRHVYVLVRDCPGNTVKEEKPFSIDDKTYHVIFIPNLNDHANLSGDLKIQGYTILHSETNNLRCVNDNFFGNVFKSFSKENYFEKEKQLIENIMVHIRSDETEKFNSLSYYPHFVEYMQCYYKASKAIDLKVIDEQNGKLVNLGEILEDAEMGEIVFKFDKILSEKNSTLLLWKLSEELKIPSAGYTIEILWREALLSKRYCKSGRFPEAFGSHFSRYVESGEPFELIDGDNLRYFNQDIDSLLSDFYERQSQMCYSINSNPNLFKNPPIVMSIFGPQSSGKSTLLNYCFGCKFLTSAGRCTKGVYASLSKLSQPINNSDHFLILDTEGLDSNEKGKVLEETSCIEFDRTMVLFCLAVSHVVIINMTGNFGKEMKNLFQICVYSLLKLKVNKVSAPKIFFVLNQQADPDPKKHSKSINEILVDLNNESHLIENLPEGMEGITVSDLIQVSEKNLFVLPSAFNVKGVNSKMGKLFEADLKKSSPTVTFADNCVDIRTSIIKALESDNAFNIRRPFTTMREWMSMSGVIWDTTVGYQDIVKHKNIEELKCSNSLYKITSELLSKHIYYHKEEYKQKTDEIIEKIKKINTWKHPQELLNDVEEDLNLIFDKYRQEALLGFVDGCNKADLSRTMGYMCHAAKSNLERLIFIEKNIYKDILKFEIKVHMNEVKMLENMASFLTKVEENVEAYSKLSIEGRKEKFDMIWTECFIKQDKEEKAAEREEIFDVLYTIYSVESKTLENKQTIYSLLSDFKFDMDKIIQMLEMEILGKLRTEPKEITENDNFLFPWKNSKTPIKEMNSKTCEFLTKESLYYAVEKDNTAGLKFKLTLQEWVPSECNSLIEYCSGYFNEPDINWETPKRIQILKLASQLKDPNNLERSTWEKFVFKIKTEVQKIIDKESNISHSTIKEIVNFLCTIFREVNDEISCIEAKLTNKAERTITTFALALVMKSIHQNAIELIKKSTIKDNIKKINLDYFLQKMENPKIDREGWDRKRLRKGDMITARKFAGDILEYIRRNVYDNCQRNIYDEYFKKEEYSLSQENLLVLANIEVEEELKNHSENIPINEDNLVVQFICNHAQNQKRYFQREWMKLTNLLYQTIFNDMKKAFDNQLSTLVNILQGLLNGMVTPCGSRDGIELDSDSNFVISGETSINELDSLSCKLSSFRKRAPSKAILCYLKMYLDPNVSPEEFNNFFDNIFKIDGFAIKMSPKASLRWKKSNNPAEVLDKDLFEKLTKINIFNNADGIFNIKVYIEEFLDMLRNYEFTFDYEELIKSTKEDFQSRAICCPNQCPSCGKFCEREIHQHSGKCQILTGHQICSMGGKAWNANKDKTAILLMCEDYEEDSPVLIPGFNIKWWEFKEKCGSDWEWTLPKYDKFFSLQMANREKMKDIWNKYGKAILEYYSKNGTQINYIPYTSPEAIKKSLFSLNSYVCFVIDGTKLMGGAIKFVKHWVSEHMKILEGISNFRVVVYHGHCLEQKFIEAFPNNSDFTSEKNQIQNFLDKMSIYGDQDDEYALLHGLATAVTGSNWETGFDIRNIIVHIYIEPTMGYTKPFIAKENCPHGCSFNWEKYIRIRMNELRIKYERLGMVNRKHPDHGSGRPVSYDNKNVDLSPEKKFKSEVFINYKPDK